MLTVIGILRRTMWYICNFNDFQDRIDYQVKGHEAKFKKKMKYVYQSLKSLLSHLFTILLTFKCATCSSLLFWISLSYIE